MRIPALVLLTLALGGASARADDGTTEAVPWDDCDDCSTRDSILAEPGAGPEVGPLARLELGSVGAGIEDGDGGHAVTAGFGRVRLAVGLSRTLGVRASATVQVLDATRAQFPFTFGADAGGAIALGVTRTLHTIDLGMMPIAATLDGELASGPAVRSGLGLRSLADGRRDTIAPGLAAAGDFDVASVRGHARYLRTHDHAAATVEGAIELGLGAAMRINWSPEFWGGRWPIEAWADYRYRRGVGASAAREHEVRGGIDYTLDGRIDRIGVQLVGTRDQTGDGHDVRGMGMLLTVQYGHGL